MRPLVILIAAALVFASCEKNRTMAPGAHQKCKIYGLCILLSDKYTLEEIDTIYIAKYNAGTSFSRQLENEMLTLADTGYLSPGYQLNDRWYSPILEHGYDYELSVPGANQVFRVYDIQNPPDSMGGSAGNGKTAPCDRFIRQYTATGGPTSLVPVWDKKYSNGLYGIVFGE